MKGIDDTEEKIIRAMTWLETRRRDAKDRSEGLKGVLWFNQSYDPNFDRYRLGELLSRIKQFDVLIAQHKRRLRDYRQAQRLSKRQLHESRLRQWRQQEQQRLHLERQQCDEIHELDEADPEPLMYAVPRPDVFTVKNVEQLPTFAEHALTTQIARRAESLEAWNYRCLGTRNRRPSRRYEGYQMSATSLEWAKP